MNYIETYEKLKALNTGAFNLSIEDKKYIKELSKELNIPFVVRKNCNNCYRDQLIILSIFVKKQLQPIEVSNCDFVVIGNKDVSIRGVRINNDTLTNELAEWLMRTFRGYERYIKRK